MNKIIQMIRKILGINVLAEKLEENQKELLSLVGSLLDEKNKNKTNVQDLSELEFKVYSQWGDDGIISWLTDKISSENPFFVEFGVQTYRESNTRFLVTHKNWAGLIIDGNKDYIDGIKEESIFWKHDLNAKHLFITKDNIDNFLKQNCPRTDIELLSIDIDGNDYWIFESLKEMRPKLIICEFNSLFGNEADISIPYSESFVRSNAHYSNLYFGTSIQALIRLSTTKDYVFIGTNSHGNNAYFLDNQSQHELIAEIKKPKIFEAKFRESRDQEGRLTFLSKKAALELIGNLPVMDFKTGSMRKISELNV